MGEVPLYSQRPSPNLGASPFSEEWPFFLDLRGDWLQWRDGTDLKGPQTVFSVAAGYGGDFAGVPRS